MTAAAWGGSSAGVIVIGVCAVLLWFARRHAHRIHQQASPWLYRLLIFGMYVGGCAVALTALGGYVIGFEMSVAGLLGGVRSGAGYEVAVIGGFVVLGAALAGAVLEPGPAVAWFALAVPFVCALSGGHLHGVLTVFPVTEWASQVSQWLGGR